MQEERRNIVLTVW